MFLPIPVSAQSGGRHADTVTFSEPVQLPGITLPAGSYLFEHVAGPGGANRVTVSAAASNKLVAQIRVVPLQRGAIGNAITFRPTAVGMMPAISGWFPGKGKAGQEFLYTAAEQQASAVVPSGAIALVK
jgi:hypothetical protein